MSHWKALFDYKHLGVQDLPRGANNSYVDLVVHIKTLAKREVITDGGRKELLPVAELHGAAKPMIINKTNFKTLAALFQSSEYEDYVNKPFTLYAAKVKGKAGGIVDGLRIREDKPEIAKKTLAELTPTHPRWDGAKKAILDGNTTIEAIKNNYTLSPQNEALLTNK